MRKIFISILLSLVAIEASAQQSPLSLGGEGDIVIVAQTATYKGQETFLEGQVDVKQGEAQILSDRMKIIRDKGNSSATGEVELGAMSRIEAHGNFVYETPENRITGDTGIYVRRTGVITVTGDVKVVQPQGNTATTDKLIYNVSTESIEFVGNCSGNSLSLIHI